MFDAFYNAALAMWRTLYGFAQRGTLADGSRMPPALRGMIVAHYAVVVALVARGRAADASDLATHRDVVVQLVGEQNTLRALLNRFGMLSTVSAATTPLWTHFRRGLAAVRQADPELGNLIDANLPNLPTTNELRLEVGLAIAAGIGLFLWSQHG